MPTKRKLRVFLCHASQDKPVVRDLYKKLAAETWIDPWLDEKKILPGQDWDTEIKKALDGSDAVITFLSRLSVAKEGYLQKEFKAILEEALEKPKNTIFVIPMRIQNCDLPDGIQNIQAISYFPPSKKKWAYDRLMQSLKQRAESLGIPIGKERGKARPSVDAPQAWKVGPQKSLKPKSDQRLRSSVVVPRKNSRSLSTPGRHAVHTFGGLQFVRVPAGPFIMGSEFGNALSYPDERPQLTINIPYDYFIGRFPVTVSEYLKFVEWTGLEHEWEGDIESRQDHPITCVSWENARDFCKWLNSQYVDELPVRSDIKLVFRLATEAEWEKAARGERGWEWPWGSKFDKTKCNCLEGGLLTTTPVGSYSSLGGDSPYGAADMAGNVWEWTNTLFERYPYQSGDGRETKQGKGLQCVVRGGCYRDPQRYVRACYRYMIPNSSLYYFQGFRVVVAPPVSVIG